MRLTAHKTKEFLSRIEFGFLKIILDQILNSAVSFVLLSSIYRHIDFKSIGYLSSAIAISYIVSTAIRIGAINSLYLINELKQITIYQHLNLLKDIFRIVAASMIFLLLLITTFTPFSVRLQVIELILLMSGIIFADIIKNLLVFHQQVKLSIILNSIFFLGGLVINVFERRDETFSSPHIYFIFFIAYCWIYITFNILRISNLSARSISLTTVEIYKSNTTLRQSLVFENLITSMIYLFTLFLLMGLDAYRLGIINLANFYFCAIPVAFFSGLSSTILRSQSSIQNFKLNILKKI